MPRKHRESSYKLQDTEEFLALSLAEKNTTYLADQINEARSKNPNLFYGLEAEVAEISLQISRMCLQLRRALKIYFDSPLSLQFRILDKTSAFAELDRGQFSLVISLLFLEKIAKEMKVGRGRIAISELRFVMAHEFFHIYCIMKYQATMIRSSRASKNKDIDKDSYILDLGEQGADLFGIEHLLNQEEDSVEQKQTNQAVAMRKKSRLKQKIFLARARRKIKSFRVSLR